MTDSTGQAGIAFPGFEDMNKERAHHPTSSTVGSIHLHQNQSGSGPALFGLNEMLLC
jgi:hypothetical protein